MRSERTPPSSSMRRPPGPPAPPCRASPPCPPGTRRRGPSGCARRSGWDARRPRPPCTRVDRCHVVAVDLDRAPAEGLRAPREHVGVPAVHRGPALTQPVEVQDRVRLSTSWYAAASIASHTDPSAISESPMQHPHARRALRPCASRAPCRGPRPVPGRASPLATSIHGSSGTGAGCPWIGEPNRRSDNSMLVVDRADRLQHRVERRCGVALRHHEPVVGGEVGDLDVGAQVARVQDGEQMGARHRRGGMARAGRGRGADAVHRDLRGEVVPELDAVVHRVPPSGESTAATRRCVPPRRPRSARALRYQVARSTATRAPRPVLLALARRTAPRARARCRAGIEYILGVERVGRVCTDDYHRYDRATRAELGVTPLAPDVQPARPHGRAPAGAGRGQPVTKPTYDHHTGRSGPRRPCRPRRS